MRERIVGLLEKLDLAVATSVGVIDHGVLEPVARARNEIQMRLAYPDSVVVAGLVGGTGSGKSSILNAIAGAEVAESGGVRPTTDQPLALVPAAHLDSMAGYLDLLGVTRRVEWESNSWLCLIDLPDTDSVVADHRLAVDHLLPRLDVVVWVLDPEKYRDRNTHDMIAGLSRYESQFVFVLNQIDRLGNGQPQQLAADLLAALGQDGLTDPTIQLMAAQPVAGPPIGLDELLDALAGVIRDRPSVNRKLAHDIGALGRILSDAIGGGSGLDFDARWSRLMDRIATTLEAGRPSEATHFLISSIEEIAVDASGPLTDEVRAVSGLVPEFSGDSVGVNLEEVDRRVGDALRGLLRRRANAQAAIADLVLEAARLSTG